MADKWIVPAESSLLVRVREFSSTLHTRNRKRGVPMATYRVVLQIDVSASDVVRSRGKDTLRDLRAEGGDYLRAHIENEMGWLEQSFSRVEIKSITRVKPKRDEQG